MGGAVKTRPGRKAKKTTQNVEVCGAILPFFFGRTSLGPPLRNRKSDARLFRGLRGKRSRWVMRKGK